MNQDANDAFQLFRATEDEFERLQDLFQDRVIDVEEFTARVDELQLTDDTGIEWQIGLQTGKWYRKEADEWVEDDPYTDPLAPRKEIDWRAWIKRIAFLVLGVVSMSLCYIAFSLLFNGNFFARGAESLDMEGVEEQVAAQIEETATVTDPSNMEGGGEAEDNGALPTAQASASGDQVSGETPTPSLVPTMTSTPLPPEPRVPPQVWENAEQELFTSPELIGETWASLLREDLEYEFLTYENDESLFLQYDVTAALWYASGVSLKDVDRSLRLVVLNPNGVVNLTCRYDPETGSGYLLQITNQEWRLVYQQNWERTRLAEGTTPEHFREGGFVSYRLRCAGQQITVREDERLAAAAEDPLQAAGQAGVILESGDQPGVVILAEDGVSVLKEGGAARIGDSVWLDSLELQLEGIGPGGEYRDESGAIRPYSNAKLWITKVSGPPVLLAVENVYLEKDGERIYALDGIAVEAFEDPIRLPLNLAPGEVSGIFVFSGLSGQQMGEWQLVIDLRYQELGEARFRLD